MKVLLVNSVCGIGSTGRICVDLAMEFEKQGHEVKIAYGRDYVPQQYKKYAVQIGNSLVCKLHGVRTRLLDEHGFGSKSATTKFLDWAEEYSPELLWLHNIHGYYINIELLFDWIKKRPKMQVKWTLHDCWAFTGHCPHFAMIKCEQWKQGCVRCGQKKCYPSSLLKDNCKQNYARKKKAFTGVKNMVIITPSCWLANLVKQSFLQEYPVEVHYNKVDTSKFMPSPSNFKERVGIQDRQIILGVSSVWHERKGLNDFGKLVQMLDETYVVVLVGLSKKQIQNIPKAIEGRHCTNVIDGNIAIYDTIKGTVFAANEKDCYSVDEESIRTEKGVAVPAHIENVYKEITGGIYQNHPVKKQASLVCIPKTNNIKELAEIYTAADFFVNPTYEDNYPTVNLEAIACGTYVVTYLTGGCAETLA